MFRRTKECYCFICENPAGCWRMFLMLTGTLCSFLLGVVVFGFLALLEKITGKDYLLNGPKRIISSSTPEDGDEEEV